MVLKKVKNYNSLAAAVAMLSTRLSILFVKMGSVGVSMWSMMSVRSVVTCFFSSMWQDNRLFARIISLISIIALHAFEGGINDGGY